MYEINSIEEIDFNKLWKNAFSNSRIGKREKDLSKFWDDRAKKYNEDIKKNDYEKGEKQIENLIKNLNINSETESTILEIGPGPGTITIPLARKVKEVTVVEPSHGMLNQLMENAREEKIDNIIPVNKKWEDINTDDANELKKHDVVVASLSLSMLDITEALQKMNELANKYVYIFWFVNRPVWEEFYINIYRYLHNKPYIPAPKAIYVYNILNQMGIYANVEVKYEDYLQKFSDFDEALGFLRDIMDIKTKKQEESLKNYLQENLEDLTLNGKSAIATIWWEKKKLSE